MIFNHCPEGITGPLHDSPNLRSYGVFTSAKRSWTFSQIAIAFRRFSPPFRIAIIQLMFPLLLVVPLSRQHHPSRIDEVLRFDDSMIDLHKISPILMNCLYTSFGLLRICVLARIRLYPLSCEILYHDSVSVFVPGFPSFVEDFVIRCYHVTKLSARGRASPVRFLQGALVILVLLRPSQFRSYGKESKNTVSPTPLFLEVPNLVREVLAGVSLDADTVSSSSISSSVCAEPRLSEACLPGFVCIGFPHACLARRLVIGSVDASDSPEKC